MGICSLFVFAIIAFDIVTGASLSVFALYLGPIYLSVWFVGRRFGVFISAASAISWVFCDILLQRVGVGHPLILFWDCVLRMGVFVVVGGAFGALREALLHERQLARNDFLTGIPNNKSFYERLDEEIERSQRYGFPLTIAYLDCDNFKTVNDTKGHSEGDALLTAAAHLIQKIIRKTDMAARLGGDEFAVLFPGAGPEGAKVALSKLGRDLNQLMVERQWEVTFSIGAVTFNTVPGTSDDVVREADEMMYRVKAHGKNRIEHRIVGEPESAGNSS
jgi:diguanylate cyclase (GGDEF)-like protein